MERLFKALSLILLGLFLYSRVVGDAIYFYINERFITLTLLASGGLLLVGASYYLGNREEKNEGARPGRARWSGLLILALPFLLGWLVPPRPLGATALANRELAIGGGPGGLRSVSAPADRTTAAVFSGERNILDWLNAFEDTQDLDAHVGQEARVVGFVYRDDRFGPDSFLVARYTVSCCVADAAPIGLVVRTEEAESLESDSWVEVSGHFTRGDFNGSEIPVLSADSVRSTSQPEQPYLYP